MARRLLPYGERAVLVECADLNETRALYDWLRMRREAEDTSIVDVIPGARTLLLRLARPLSPEFEATLVGIELPKPDLGETSTITIGVRYDGEDLAEVAAVLGCTTEQVVERHTEQTWSVAFCGFAPGFAYLAPETSAAESAGSLRVPRRADPRTRVPPGSVGLADQWSGIYPRAAPGGWQLIGRTRRRVWDLGQDPPALLQPGIRVRFEVES